MSSPDRVGSVFADIDTNRDGKIDRNELRNWVSNNDEMTSTIRRSTSGELLNRTDNYGDVCARYRNRGTYYPTTVPCSVNVPPSFSTVPLTTEVIGDSTIETRSIEETNRYLARSSSNIFIDPNPRIVRRETTERPITQEQRITIRYFQPPPLPPLPPLIVREVRPPQPPPPPPLVIREHPGSGPAPAPLILREKPPKPPAIEAGETVTRVLPALPVPPRSLVVERFPAVPERPRDIIIERWLPYPPQPERKTVVEHAPSAVEYPKPTHTVIVYDNVQARVNRKFENLGVTQEHPCDYVNRHGLGALLDPATLVREARSAGVVEDLSPPAVASSISTNLRGNTSELYRSGETINQGYTSSAGVGYDGVLASSGGYSSKYASHRGVVDDGSYGTQAGFHIGDTTVGTTSTKHYEKLDKVDSQAYI